MVKWNSHDESDNQLNHFYHKITFFHAMVKSRVKIHRSGNLNLKFFVGCVTGGVRIKQNGLFNFVSVSCPASIRSLRNSILNISDGKLNPQTKHFRMTIPLVKVSLSTPRQRIEYYNHFKAINNSKFGEVTVHELERGVRTPRLELSSHK